MHSEVHSCLSWAHRVLRQGVLLQVNQLVGHKLFQALQVLSVKLHVVVAGTFYPKGLHRPLAALIQGQAVGEVDHLVLRTVDHQDWWGHFGDLVNAARVGGGQSS